MNERITKYFHSKLHDISKYAPFFHFLDGKNDFDILSSWKIYRLKVYSVIFIITHDLLMVIVSTVISENVVSTK